MLTDAETAALLLSLKVAVWATVIALPLAIPVALLMARKQFFGKSFIDTILHLPLVVPPVVIGYLLLITLAPASRFGSVLSSIGLNPSYSWQGAAIASGLMAFPLIVRSIRLSFETENPAYRETVSTLGLSPWRQFTKVSLPLALPGIITGGILGFARAIGEFGATITFAANIPGLTQTLPLALYSAAQSPGGEEAAFRLAILCLIPAVGSLLLSDWLGKRAQKRVLGL